MPEHRPKTLTQIAREHSRLDHLLQQAQVRDDLNKKFRDALPAHLKALVTLVCVRDGILRITVPDGTVAARLRMEQSAIMARLRASGAPFECCYRFDIRIRPIGKAAKASRKPRPLTQESAGHLLEAARHENDEGLKKALEALARLAR